MKVCWRLVRLHWVILVAIALGLLRSTSIRSGEYFNLLLPIVMLVSILVVKESRINNYNKLLVTMPIVRSNLHSYILIMQWIVIIAYCLASEVGLLIYGAVWDALIEWLCLGILCLVITGVELLVRLFYRFGLTTDNDVMVVKNTMLYALAIFAGCVVPFLARTCIDTIYKDFDCSVYGLIRGGFIVGSVLFFISWLFIKYAIRLKKEQEE